MARPAPDPVEADKRADELGAIADGLGGWTNAAKAISDAGYNISPTNLRRAVKRTEGRWPGDELMRVARSLSGSLPTWMVGEADTGGQFIARMIPPYFVAPIVKGRLDTAKVTWTGPRGANADATLADAKAYLKGL